jgi:peptide/nickel transport system substrate-binding protein
VTDDTLTLQKFDKYWKADHPYLDGVTYKYISDNDTLLTAVQTGSVDIAAELPSAQVHTASTSPGVKVVNMGQLGVTRISLNWSKPPFNDIRARQAINYATDTDAINKALNFDLAPSITHPFSAFYPDLRVDNYPKYDLAKARELVNELGGHIDFQLTAASTTLAWAQAAQAMWKEAGINAEIQLMDSNAQIAGLVSGNFEAGTSGYSGAWDPDLVSYDMFYTGANRNYPRMSDPEVDKLLVEGRSGNDAAARQQIYTQIANKLGVDLPYVWMYGMSKNAVTTERVHNIPLNGDGMLRLTSVWVSE